MPARPALHPRRSGRQLGRCPGSRKLVFFESLRNRETQGKAIPNVVPDRVVRPAGFEGLPQTSPEPAEMASAVSRAAAKGDGSPIAGPHTLGACMKTCTTMRLARKRTFPHLTLEIDQSPPGRRGRLAVERRVHAASAAALRVPQSPNSIAAERLFQVWSRLSRGTWL